MCSLGSQAFPLHIIVRILIVRGRETFEIGEFSTVYC